MNVKLVTKWEQIAVHGSRRLAEYGGRLYNLHEDIRYTVKLPSPCTVVLSELKSTLEESQQAVLDNINCDFAPGKNTILIRPADSIEIPGEPKKPAKYFLVAEEPPQSKFEIKKDAVIIGRDESCDIVIAKPHVSRRHCLVQLIGRRLRFRNLESANGIYINGVRVRDGFVKSGDKLALGGYTFTVHREK